MTPRPSAYLSSHSCVERSAITRNENNSSPTSQRSKKSREMIVGSLAWLEIFGRLGNADRHRVRMPLPVCRLGANNLKLQKKPHRTRSISSRSNVENLESVTLTGFSGTCASKGESEKSIQHFETIRITFPFDWHDRLHYHYAHRALVCLFCEEGRLGVAHARLERAR